jgi:hypothetical protein
MAEAWYQQTNAKFRFDVPRFTTTKVVSNDSRNVVIVRDELDGNRLATTNAFFRVSDMKLLSFDIVVHARNKIVTNVRNKVLMAAGSACTDRFILDAILIHEFGHALGLGDSPVSNATMFGSIPPCATGNMSLASDDIAGVEAFYGIGEP